MKHIELLQRCHDFLRGVVTVTPEGSTTHDGDRLAKEINAYLNHTQTHAEGCWSWGPQHYMCAYNRIKEMESKNV